MFLDIAPGMSKKPPIILSRVERSDEKQTNWYGGGRGGSTAPDKAFEMFYIAT